jgi:hypothetical protein
MGNMQILPIMANTNNKSRFNNNMQYPCLKTMPFVIEMGKKKVQFCFASFRFFSNFCTFISYSEILFIIFLVLNDFSSIFSS